MRVFINYKQRAHPDHEFAANLERRFGEDGHDVFRDETGVAPSQPWPERLYEEVKKCDVFVAVVSNASLQSTWCLTEIDRAQELGKRIFPILLEDINESLDFKSFKPRFMHTQCYRTTGNFEQDADALCEALRVNQPESCSAPSVERHTSFFLDDLRNATIDLPLRQPIAIIPTLRALPRVGKQLRLRDTFAHVKIRSVYDHILSCAHSADFFYSQIKHDMSEQDLPDLARFISYHDLCEALVGDIPAFTNIEDYDPAFRPKLTRRQKQQREKVANQFLVEFLAPKYSASLSASIKISRRRNKSHLCIHKFATFLDAIDPIIAVWRYLHVYRRELETTVEQFLYCLRDFFENPKVIESCEANVEDKKVCRLVRLLQNQQVARKYHQDRSYLKYLSEQCEFDHAGLEMLLEGRLRIRDTLRRSDPLSDLQNMEECGSKIPDLG